jgi:hypothetical protein
LGKIAFSNISKLQRRGGLVKNRAAPEAVIFHLSGSLLNLLTKVFQNFINGDFHIKK